MYSFLIKWRNVNIVVYGNLKVKCNFKKGFLFIALAAILFVGAEPFWQILVEDLLWNICVFLGINSSEDLVQKPV